MPAQLTAPGAADAGLAGVLPDDARTASVLRLLEAAALACDVPYAALATAGDGDFGLLTYGFAPDPKLRAELLGAAERSSSEHFSAGVGSGNRGGSRGGACVPAGIGWFAGSRLPSATSCGGGVLAVLGRTQRAPGAREFGVLNALAAAAAAEIDSRTALERASNERRLSSLVESSPPAVVTLDSEGRVLAWGAAAERLYGWRADDVVGRAFPAIPGGRGNPEFARILAAARGGDGGSARFSATRRDGSPVELQLSTVPLAGEAGRVDRLLALGQDLAEFERSEYRSRLFESVVTASPAAVAIATGAPPSESRFLFVNEALTQLFGYAAGDLAGCGPAVLYAGGDDDAQAALAVAEAKARCLPIAVERLARRKDGTTFWCEFTVSPVNEAGGGCANWVELARDVTERRLTERRRVQREGVLELIAGDAAFDRILQAIVETAEDARPGAGARILLREGDVLLRKAAGARLGLAFEAFDGRVRVGDSSDPSGLAAHSGARAVFVDLTNAPGGAFRAFAREAGITSSWATPVRLGDGTVAGTFEMHVRAPQPPSEADLLLASEFAHLAGIALASRNARERLEFLALHDALTTLPNRVLFERRLARAVAAAEASGRGVAVGMIDLDRFKVINDSLGHAAGDQLLRDVAERLASFARPQDSVARLGGDEFVLLMTDIGAREEAAAIARRALLALAPSFTCAGQEVFVRASAGIASFPQDARSTEELLAKCDEAMYSAKAQGRDVAFHVQRENRDGVSRIALETSLTHALENSEFEVFFQPQVDLRTRELRGVEALLRWNHPALGRVVPDTFIRAAEDTGLIVPIGAWVLEQACRFALRWQRAGDERFVAVNVSARQFDRHDFVETVTGTLARTGLDPGRLHLELTETLVMRSPENAAATLAELKALGVKIVIDDFGTGYSSFNYLKRFPIDALKIDRLFMRDIGFGRRASGDEAIVRAIVGVARALDLKIVAEGVETEDQAAFLRAIAVPLAQGFLFAPALPPREALDWHPAAAAP